VQNPDIETVLTEVIDLGSSPEERLRLEYRSSPAAGWDLKAISGKPDVLHRLKEVFQDRTFVEQFGIKGTSAFIRFDDAYVAGQMERLLNGGSTPAIPSPFRGTRAIVQFIDPNTTKALHLGHMYEAILGNAFAALLTSRGADVKRYCFVSDISRSVCEAMAGFDMFGDGKRP